MLESGKVNFFLKMEEYKVKMGDIEMENRRENGNRELKKVWK